MKKLIAVAALITAFNVQLSTFNAAYAAAIEQVIVRQQWPWSTDVKVEYKLTGVTVPVDLTVKAYNGDVELPLPAAAVTGDLYGIAEDGIGQFTIDPVAAFGTEKVALANFKVKLQLSDSAANVNEVLYKIFCLTNGVVTDVSRKDLLNGKWGSVETDFSKIGPGFNTTLDDVIIWTAVTNDVKYKTTHLVMRKIPAAAAGAWMMGAPAGEPGRSPTDVRETRHQVTLTKDYWMAVFEWTKGQRQTMFNGDLDDDYAHPYTSCTWDNGDSFFAKLTQLTGQSGFCFATEAQWEFACRAGTTTGLNSGKDWGESYEAGPNTTALSEVGWVRNCPGVISGETHGVGEKCPNAFGLYDTLGNAAEWCNDWFYNGDLNDLAQTVDPTGPASDSAPNCEANQKVLRGGSVGHAYYNARSATRDRAHKANAWQTTYIGWRFCLVTE